MISVCALVDPTVYTSDSVIVDKTANGDAANYRFGIFGGGELFFWNGSQAVFSNAVIPLNTFTQVGFTLNGATDTLQFYINGVLDSTRTVGFGALNTAPLLIGRALPGQFFEGMIEDVAIYHGVLTGAQMSLLAPPVTAAPTFPTYPGLVSQIVAQNGAVDTTGNTAPSVSGSVAYGTGVVGQEFQLFGGNTPDHSSQYLRARFARVHHRRLVRHRRKVACRRLGVLPARASTDGNFTTAGSSRLNSSLPGSHPVAVVVAQCGNVNASSNRSGFPWIPGITSPGRHSTGTTGIALC